MRISDWSSDVCSSDLLPPVALGQRLRREAREMSRVQDHSDRERPIASDALTDKERAVLQLTDAGLDRSAIADRTGLKLHRVASIQNNYADNGRDRKSTRLNSRN